MASGYLVAGQALLDQHLSKHVCLTMSAVRIDIPLLHLERTRQPRIDSQAWDSRTLAL